ncbi:reverse transcriptase family protein [Curtobacterium sp. MCSS17_007]|uniref:reverse transcriptase family protein n=1 Tax=Curtobacterium sp. MCSS17_007 TaxID=2175646 RepID=UPI000DAA4DE2|nr:reverse transcriptase family protein [Curtobacterium sp. MCSS17_007]WIE76946.1 reverse transcriptase family protein [Curtobacterium sp. MCSS17_007]
MEFPGEAADARDASTSPGSPRGTRDQHHDTPRAGRRAPRATPHGGTDGSSGNPTPLDVVATALADAFLAADGWTPDDLTAAGYAVVGIERAFVGLAVATALDSHPRPPVDAPRQLGRVLAAAPRLVELHRSRAERRPVRVLARRATPVRSRAVTDGPLLVDTLPELARALDVTLGRLLWLADTRAWNRQAHPDSPLHHFRHEWVERPGRVPRLLEKPMDLLRRTQRRILDGLLVTLPVHDAVHGFVHDRSVVTGAALHTGQQIVLTADLTSFFATVTAPNVYGVFRSAGYAEPLAHVLTGLCTHRVPPHVLTRMPPGGRPEERAALREALAAAHLPQGAPSSPALANTALRHLDARLAGWAAASEARYSRYADDLTFSGGDRLAARPDAFLRGVGRIVADQGYRLNPHKTRARRRGTRQSVTGVVVNDRTSPGRREVDRLHAILHNAAEHGPASQDRAGHPDFRAHLLGRIGWVEQVHPGRARRLREEFARIRW